MPRNFSSASSAAGCVSPGFNFNYVSIDSAATVRAKVALVGRGTCSFVEKALHAQAAGALAMVVVNNVPDVVVHMGGGASSMQSMHGEQPSTPFHA